jgi:cobalt-zinc-cadmium efflux system membrane fusion protein
MPNNISYLACFSLLALITACTDPAEHTQTVPQPPKVPGEVYLTPDSPKIAYVKTARLSLSQHPLLEPLAGKIIYDETATSRISSPVAGRIITTPIALGSVVTPATKLVELDSPDVASAEADFIKAQADLTLANHAYERQQALYEGKAASKKDLEQALDDVSDAHSDLQRAQNRLKNLHLSSSQHDGRFTLHASIPGVVVERNANPGMEVRPDLDKPLFVVTNLSKLTVLMEVFEVNLSKIQVAQKLSVSVPAYPGEEFQATVQYIGQVLDEQTRTVQVRCELPNPDGRLLPGMYAVITLTSRPEELAITIPLTSVFTEGDSDYVFVAIDDFHFQQRPIEIGLRLKDQAIVSNGLKANDRLVTEGALMLRAEEEVETTNTNP